MPEDRDQIKNSIFRHFSLSVVVSAGTNAVIILVGDNISNLIISYNYTEVYLGPYKKSILKL